MLTETKVFNLVKAAIRLAIVRHGMTDADGADFSDQAAEEVAVDTWNVLRGIHTCSSEPAGEWIAVEDCIRKGTPDGNDVGASA